MSAKRKAPAFEYIVHYILQTPHGPAVGDVAPSALDNQPVPGDAWTGANALRFGAEKFRIPRATLFVERRRIGAGKPFTQFAVFRVDSRGRSKRVE